MENSGQAGIMVAVGAVIEDESGRVLLVKHVKEKGGYWAGKWICPGGKLELGETIEQGIMREIREETNLEIRLTGAIQPFDRVVKEGELTILHVIYVNYCAEMVGGELKPGSDVGEAVWMSKEAIPGVVDELHEDTARLLKLANIISVGGN